MELIALNSVEEVQWFIADHSSCVLSATPTGKTTLPWRTDVYTLTHFFTIYI